jgi:phosphatidylglycerophosphatase A
MKKFIHYAIASGFGSGFAPVAPGTAGSLLALVIFYLFPLTNVFWIIIILVVFFIGVHSATAVENYMDKEDPGMVVVDEMAGQWIALLFIPVNYYTLSGAFILFRVFDIFKPYPINKSQKLKGGWGIMVDDVIAGVYANFVLQLILLSGIIK